MKAYNKIMKYFDNLAFFLLRSLIPQNCPQQNCPPQNCPPQNSPPGMKD
jgi:hypothetical protein